MGLEYRRCGDPRRTPQGRGVSAVDELLGDSEKKCREVPSKYEYDVKGLKRWMTQVLISNCCIVFCLLCVEVIRMDFLLCCLFLFPKSSLCQRHSM